MRDSRKEANTNISEHLATFIATLQGRLIVTRRLGNGNSRKEDSAMMLRAPAVGRVCTEDEKAFLTKKSVSDWCKENAVAPKAIKEQMDSTGYINSEKSMYIGQGSTTPTALSRCYEINYHRLFESEGLSIIADGDDDE